MLMYIYVMLFSWVAGREFIHSSGIECILNTFDFRLNKMIFTRLDTILDNYAKIQCIKHDFIPELSCPHVSVGRASGCRESWV